MKPKQKSAMSMERRNALVGISFILPNFIGFLIFVLIPVIFSFILAFMDWDGFTEMKFVGIENFLDIFDDRVFRAALVQTVIFSIFTVAFSHSCSVKVPTTASRMSIARPSSAATAYKRPENLSSFSSYPSPEKGICSHTSDRMPFSKSQAFTDVRRSSLSASESPAEEAGKAENFILTEEAAGGETPGASSSAHD